MSAALIRGWCPGAHRPMQSGDGLVVRIRPPLGALSPAQARGLADLADRFGNGIIDLTNRANLQMRGVTPAAHPELLEALAPLGLLDPDPALEARRNIVIDPLRPMGAGDPQTRIAAALTEGLADPELSALPSKFGFAIDAGEKRQLDQISGDIRIEASGADLILRPDGHAFGRAVTDPEEAARLALDLARWFLASGGVGADGRGRMAPHLAKGAVLPPELSGEARPNPVAEPARPGPRPEGLLVALAFGQLTSEDLRRLAESGAELLRISPWRMVFLPGIDRLSGGDFILAPDAPLLRLTACPGAPKCPQSSVETRALAREIAPHLRAPLSLHVSGCPKGCAHPGPADLTLVGGNGHFDLIVRGRADDAPQITDIAPRDAAKLIGTQDAL